MNSIARRNENGLRSVFGIAAIAFCLSACSSYGSGPRNNSYRLSEDERHRLYSAALAASESPLDTNLFKDVCTKIGIFDAGGNPNDHYMSFVTAHVEWGMKSETDQFRQQINTKEKASAYISEHLPQ